jgi:hypothetical protein
MNDVAIKQLVGEFIRILNVAEESEGGRLFYPNRVTSCRASDGARMNEILTELKSLIKTKE